MVLLSLRCGDVGQVLSVRLTFPDLKYRLNTGRTKLPMHPYGVGEVQVGDYGHAAEVQTLAYFDIQVDDFRDMYEMEL